MGSSRTGADYEWRLLQGPILEHEGVIVHETAHDPLAVAHFLDNKIDQADLFPDSCAGIQEFAVSDIGSRPEDFGFKLMDPHYMDSIQDIGERTMVIRPKERKFGAGFVDAWRKGKPEFLAGFEAALSDYETRLSNSPTCSAMHRCMSTTRYSGFSETFSSAVPIP